jgi:hypothetical protein
MTSLLRKAFDEANRLPEEEQDTVAAWLLAEIESEQKWREAFASSEDLLASLAEEALAEHRSGLTEDLDPERI